MAHSKNELVSILEALDFGASVAEQDDLLEAARVETSAFSDLLNDRIDLIPGTKGSGKSALYRIFTAVLPPVLAKSRRVVIAHGVKHQGDSVFHAFKDHFEDLAEDEFVSFWCIYLVSLAHEQFVKAVDYQHLISGNEDRVRRFKEACAAARIPDVPKPLSLRGILEWTLSVMKSWRPKITYEQPESNARVSLDMFARLDDKSTAEPRGDKKKHDARESDELPQYVSKVVETLESLLDGADLSLWLMIDRLDEIFLRRSETETRALRGLLRTLRVFDSKRIRVKLFLRDDILEQIVAAGQGFTALTHLTARQADPLKWSEGQLLTMIVKRVCAKPKVREFLNVDMEMLNASVDYQTKVFYKVFPPTVHSGERQSSTMRWLFTHTTDGRGVATPRDIIDLMARARQRQLDECAADRQGTSEWLIGSPAILYGMTELSKRKRSTLLEAEFPHLWDNIKKLIGGRTEYTMKAAEKLWGLRYKEIVEDLVSIGLVSRSTRHGESTIKVPHLYREGLDLTQGAVEK